MTLENNDVNNASSAKAKSPWEWDFFIAHAGADVADAEFLYELLSPNHRVFLDSKCLLPGDDWDRIGQAQRQSWVTVVLVSVNTDKAYYQREEIAAAIELARKDGEQHRVVPVLLDEPEASGLEMHYGLRLKHHLLAIGSSGLQDAAEKLRNLLHQLRARASTPNTPKQSEQSVASRSSQQLIFASIGINSQQNHWRDPRTHPLFHDYVYPEKIYDWTWQYEFYLAIDAPPEVEPVLDITVFNAVRGPILITGIGIEIVRVGTIPYSGASMPKPVQVLRSESYVLEMPDLSSYYPEELVTAIDYSLDIGKRVIIPIPNPIFLPPDGPFRYDLRLKNFARHLPRFALLRAAVDTAQGTLLSSRILFRRWM
jgi:hypothetical protein